jgi:hypothetical protein
MPDFSLLFIFLHRCRGAGPALFFRFLEGFVFRLWLEAAQRLSTGWVPPQGFLYTTFQVNFNKKDRFSQTFVLVYG